MINGSLKSGAKIRIEGASIVLPGWEWLKVVLAEDPRRDTWHVVEVQTGSTLNARKDCRTGEEAVADALACLAKHTPEDVRRRIANYVASFGLANGGER